MKKEKTFMTQKASREALEKKKPAYIKKNLIQIGMDELRQMWDLLLDEEGNEIRSLEREKNPL